MPNRQALFSRRCLQMHGLLRHAKYSTAQDTAQDCHTSASDNTFCINLSLHEALLASAAVRIQGTSIISRDDQAWSLLLLMPGGGFLNESQVTVLRFKCSTLQAWTGEKSTVMLCCLPCSGWPMLCG